MPVSFLTVLVEEHDELPDGCCMRFKAVSEPHPVRRVRYEAEGDGASREWMVTSCEADGSAGVAWGVVVEDSGAGSCTLVYGGARGLRLRDVEDGSERAEPYLLLAAAAILEV